jgi:thiol-disulfide isomerase/thioredoxin
MKRTAVLLLGVAIVAGLAVLSFTGDGTHQKGSASPLAFDLPALHGSGRVRLASYRGKPVVVTLFASWCTACQQELPAFAKSAVALRGKVQFIAVDSQETGNGGAFADHYRLAENGVAVAKDIDQSTTGGLYKAYQAHGLPVTTFYSAQGTLASKVGEGLNGAELDQILKQDYGL